MPLSKARDKERKRLAKLQRSVFQPNRYLEAHMKVYPEGFNPDGSYRKGYDPELDPYINPLLRPCLFQPKYSLGILYPDGRVRLEDMSVVQPNQSVKLYKS